MVAEATLYADGQARLAIPSRPATGLWRWARSRLGEMLPHRTDGEHGEHRLPRRFAHSNASCFVNLTRLACSAVMAGGRHAVSSTTGSSWSPPRAAVNRSRIRSVRFSKKACLS